MQLVFDMLVLQKHNMEMTVAAGEAFYTLVCLHQVNEYFTFACHSVHSLYINWMRLVQDSINHFLFYCTHFSSIFD